MIQVVYCYQGHEIYWMNVAKQGLYPVSALVLGIRKGLRTEECGIISRISFDRKLYRLTRLTIAIIDPVTEVRTGQVLNIKLEGGFIIRLLYYRYFVLLAIYQFQGTMIWMALPTLSCLSNILTRLLAESGKLEIEFR